MDDKSTNNAQPNNPMHGVKLVDILEYLVAKHGWEELGTSLGIKTFNNSPSIKSALNLLRKTQWARDKVEKFYLKSIKE